MPDPHSTDARRTRPKQGPNRRVIALSAAGVLLAAGVGTAVATQTSGHSAKPGSVAGAAAADAATAAPSPGDSGAGATSSASATPSGSPSASASASAISSRKASPNASGGAAAPGGGSGGGAAPVANVPAPSGGPTVFTGKAFDTCTAPSSAAMHAWRSSPYGAAAVYIGGQNRGCSQPNLTSSWVHTVHTDGWQLIPLYVGAQPPCQTSGNPERITAANAASLGSSDGADAVVRASALGMGAGSAVYLDMEAYDASDSACSSAVLTYVQAWDAALHSRGYFAGFYGFSKSSALAMSQANSSGASGLPDALWYALYDGTADTTSTFPFPSGQWSGPRRGHQYAVNQQENYGGTGLTVDHDAWNGPVAAIG